jgi:hypothetical protein
MLPFHLTGVLPIFRSGQVIAVMISDKRFCIYLCRRNRRGAS